MHWTPKQKTVVCFLKMHLHEDVRFGKKIWPRLRALSGVQASWSKRLHFVTFAGRILPAPTTDRLSRPMLSSPTRPLADRTS